MCGIAGTLRLSAAASPIADEVGERMLETMHHRGPDARGRWRSPDGACWLGHARLAIIDLVSGQQPLSNEDGTVWTVFNGEIYNFKELRAELLRRGHHFRTNADTEVLAHGHEEWGARGLCERLQGLFAFALYDGRRRTLVLARDHFGVKPLYWYHDGERLLFASEIKALLVHEALRARAVNRRAVAQYIVTRYASRPATMFDGVHCLPEAHFVEIAADEAGPPRPERYWDWRPGAETMRGDDALEELDTLLKHTVAMQLVSDVPLGMQLSGGVDSSMVLSLMDGIRRASGDRVPIMTFSVGFDDPRFSELHHARKVAERYGTNHHEIAIGFREFVGELPLLCWFYDEPMGEPPAVPTYYMCKRAKQDVTVMLTGEGADELFGGYSKYVFEQLAGAAGALPGRSRMAVLRSLAALVPPRGRRVRAILERLSLADEAERFASWYGGFDLVSQREVLAPGLLREVGDGGLREVFEEVLAHCAGRDGLDRFMYADVHTRMVDDILVKGDRMSMAASIEARVPFLDHRVAEFAARLPRRLKVSGTGSKILLKRLAERYVPRDVIYRRKVGFTVPVGAWFAGPLAVMLREILLSPRALDRGYFQPEVVRRLVNEHAERRVDREQELWLMLTLELWHRIFVDDDGSRAAAGRVGDEFAALLPAGPA